MHKLLNFFTANNHQPLNKSVLYMLSVTILLLFSYMSVFAGDIYVDNISGIDSNSGRTKNNSFRTIRKAVSVVKPGDFIHLLNTGTPYKESLILNNRSGTSEAGITIEGHGSTLTGSEPLNIADWEQVVPGLYKNKIIYTANRFNMDVVSRYFFLFNGKINRMGRCLKGGINAPLKQPGELNENEWTFVGLENAFYLKISPDKSLSECKIECPVRSNAVAVSNDVSYITVRDLICTNVYNDGFGLTNTANNLRFENIQSLYCGDDGISAHASVAFEVDGFVSIGNGTGICDTGNSWTSYNNVLIKDCVGVDLYFLNEKSEGQARHSIKNSVVICNAAKPVLLVTEKPEGELSVEMENVLFVGCKSGDTNVRVIGKTELIAKRCTFTGLNFIFNTKKVTIESSILSGIHSIIYNYSGTVWHGENNIYCLDHFLFNDRKYSVKSKNLSEYKTRTTDKESLWINEPASSSPLTILDIKIGADGENMLSKNSEMEKYFNEGIKIFEE